MKRSTDSGSLHGAIGVVIIAGIAGACVKSAGVVEAPMMDATASASAIALGGRPAPTKHEDAHDLPFRPGDRWTGTYTCRQGPTEMAIVFEDVSPAGGGDDSSIDVEATLEFHFAGGSSYGAADGAARMSGKYDPKSKRLRLVGEEWLEQPPSYALVNLTGTLSVRGAGSGKGSLSYSGSVEGPGCTTFSVSPPDVLDMPEQKAGARPAAPRSLPRPRP